MIALHEGSFFGNVSAANRNAGFTVCITDYEPGDLQADAMHYHDHAQIYFTINGGSIEKRNCKENEMQAGSIAFYHAGEPHQNIRKGAYSRGLNIELEDVFLARGLFNPSTIEIAVRKIPDVKFAAIKIYKELLADDDCTAVSIEMLLLRALDLKASYIINGRAPLWVTQIHQLLHDRWNEVLTLAELADAGGVSPITISKHFPQYFGCTLGVYMRKLKAERAVSLIRHAKMPLTDVAFASGFADQSHFIRVFKQHTGFLPKQFARS